MYHLKNETKMKIRFLDPTVKLIGKIDNSSEVWSFTRPYHQLITDSLVNDLEGMPTLPVHSFCQYHFQIRSSVLFRDLLFTFSGFMAWSKTSRAQAMDEVQMSSEYDIPISREIQLEYARWYEEDKDTPHDIKVRNRPYSLVGEYCVSVDKRTLQSFLAGLPKDSIYLRLFLDALGLDELNPKIKSSWKEYIPKRRVRKSGESVIINKDEVNNFVSIDCVISGSFMSHLIRSGYISIKSELLSIYQNNDIIGLSKLKYADKFNVSLVYTKERFDHMISTRTCWFSAMESRSKGDSWASIINFEVIPELRNLDTFKNTLPCKCDHDKCPFKS